MSVQIAIVEAWTAKFEGALDSIERLFEGYGRAQEHSSLRPLNDSVWFETRPQPVYCDLPRAPIAPSVDVWGYARTMFAVYGECVAVTLTQAFIDAPIAFRERPNLDEAVVNTGVLYCRNPIEDAVSLARCLLASADYHAEQPDALNIRRVVSNRATQNRTLLEASPRPEASRSKRFVSDSNVAARLVFSNAPTDSVIEDMSTRVCAVRIAGADVSLRVSASLTELPGSKEPYVLVYVCPVVDSTIVDITDKVAALLRETLANAVAHVWLLIRARVLNESHAKAVTSLFDQRASLEEIYKARQDAFALRVAFINQLVASWDPRAGTPDGAESLASCVDELLQLSTKWERECHRFEGLSSVVDGVGAAPLLPSAKPQVPRDEVIGIRDETNPFVQIGMALAHKLRSRQDHHDSDLVARWDAWLLRRSDRAAASRAKRRHYEPRRGQHTLAGERLIEVHPFRNRFALFEELNASLLLTTFMTTTSFLFLGITLDKTPRQSIDVMYLFVASFGFLIATLVYANASGSLARKGTVDFERQIEIGNRLSEYLGVYPLLFAVPLTVSRFLGHGWVAILVACLALLSMVGYNLFSGASLLERDISDETVGTDRWRYSLLLLLVLFMSIAFIGALIPLSTLQITGSVAFGIEVMFLWWLSGLLPERLDPGSYRVNDWDILGDETPSLYNQRLRDEDMAMDQWGTTSQVD